MQSRLRRSNPNRKTRPNAGFSLNPTDGGCKAPAGFRKERGELGAAYRSGPGPVSQKVCSRLQAFFCAPLEEGLQARPEKQPTADPVGPEGPPTKICHARESRDAPRSSPEGRRPVKSHRHSGKAVTRPIKNHRGLRRSNEARPPCGRERSLGRHSSCEILHRRSCASRGTAGYACQHLSRRAQPVFAGRERREARRKI